MDCSTALSLQTAVSINDDQTLTFNSGSAYTWNPNGYADVFVNADSTNCPLSSCVLKSGDCSTSFSSSYISIQTVDAWRVTVLRNVLPGWPQESFCYHCSGLAMTSSTPFFKQKDDWKIKQNLDCSTHIALVGSPVPSLTFPYALSSSGNLYKTYPTSDWFTIQSEAICGTVQCAVYDISGTSCSSSAWTSSDPHIALTSTYLELTKDKAAGWNNQVCLKCWSTSIPSGIIYSPMIGGATSNIGVQIKQIRDCTPVLTKKLASPYSFNYDFILSGGTQTIELNPNGYTDVFDHSSSSDCPLTGCYFMTNDCLTPLSPSPSHVTLKTSPYQIEVYKGVAQGWDLAKFCYKCEGANFFQYQPDIKLSQVQDCRNHINLTPGSPLDNYVLPFSSTSAQKSFQISTFITITAETDCGPTTCSLKPSGCGAGIAPAEVNIPSPNLNQIYNVKQNEEDGYQGIKFCLYCNSVKQTSSVQFDIIEIKQIRNCDTSLTGITSFFTTKPWDSKNLKLQYGADPEVAEDYLKMFDQVSQSDCPVTQCQIYEKGCEKLLVTDKLLFGSQEKLWPFSAQTTEKLGYNVTFCVKCNGVQGLSGHPTAQHDELFIQQVRDCSKHIKVVEDHPTSMISKFEENGPDEKQKITDFFEIEDEEDCGAVTCSIMEEKCLQYLTSTNAIMDPKTFEISALTSVEDGYGYRTCIECQSKSTTANIDKFIIAQSSVGCGGNIKANYVGMTDQVLVKKESSDDLWQTVGDGFSSFITVLQPERCPILECTLYLEGCTEIFGRTNNVKMSSTSPWQISAFVSGLAKDAYSESLCIACTNGDDIVTRNNFKISVNDCTNQINLSKSAKNNDIQENFSSSKNQFISALKFLESKDEEKCPLKYCEIFEKGCSAAYTGYSILSSVSDPLQILVKYNELAGYDETICIKCSNGDDYLTYDGWRVTQMPFNCDSQISSEAISNQIYSYDSKATKPVFVEPSSMFSNKDETNCPLMDCKLYSKDCSKPFPENDFVKISEKSPFSITAQRNVGPGFSYEVCIQCQFGQKDNVLFTYTQKEWIIKQSPKVNCQDIIVPSSSQPRRVFLEFDKILSKSYLFSNFFENSNPVKCLLDSCELKQKGCKIKIIQDKAVLNEKLQTISYKRNQENGYKQTSCISCKITQGHIVNFDNFKVHQNPQVTKDRPALSLKIEPMNELGQIEFFFNVEMKTKGVNLTQFSSDYNMETKRRNLKAETAKKDPLIDMYVVPYNDWISELDQYNISNLNFTWNATSFEKNLLILQLYFNEPSELSPLQNQDNLFINITNAAYEGYFQSIDGRELPPKEYIKSDNKIRKQMRNDEANRNFQSSTEAGGLTGQTTLICVFILNIFAQGALGQMLQWLRSLQMIIHLPLLVILIPPSVSAFFQVILPIVTFDLLDSDYTSGVLLEFDDPEQDKMNSYILDQMEDLGYNTHNSIVNLGSIGIFSFFYVCKVLFYFLLLIPFILVTKNRRALKWAKTIKHQLFFSEFISITLEGYFEFLIAAYLNLSQPLFTKSGEMASLYLGWYSFIIPLVIFPIMWLIVMCTPLKTLNSQKFQQKYGQLFQGVRNDKKIYIMYYLVYITRRIIFCALAFYGGHLRYVQLIFVMYTNLAIVIYQGYHNPLRGKFQNRVELFNELAIMTATANMTLFTDTMPSEKMKNLTGWWMVYYVSFNILINFLIVLKIAARQTYLILLKNFRLLRRFIQRKTEEKPVQIKPNEENDSDVKNQSQQKFKSSEEAESEESKSQQDQQEKQTHFKSISNINLETIPDEYNGVKTTKMRAMLLMIQNGDIIIDNLNPKHWQFKAILQKEKLQTQLQEKKQPNALREPIFKPDAINFDKYLQKQYQQKQLNTNPTHKRTALKQLTLDKQQMMKQANLKIQQSIKIKPDYRSTYLSESYHPSNNPFHPNHNSNQLNDIQRNYYLKK